MGDKFTPTDALKDMATFYLINGNDFEPMYGNYNVSNKIIEYHNMLKEKKLEEDAQKCADVSNQNLKHKYEDVIKKKLVSVSDYGYSDKVDLLDCKQRYISVMYERDSNAVNHDECLIDFFVNSVFYDISKSINGSVIKRNDDFDNQIKKLITKELSAVTKGFVCCSHYISDTAIRDEFETKMESIIITSKILIGRYAILKDGFSYNISCDEFIVRDLTEEELNVEIDKYLREDGQYIYEGVFLPREKVARLIKEKYAIFTLVYRYKVNTDPGSLIKVDLLNK